MIPIQEASTLGIYGAVASGKTFLMKELMKKYRRLTWYDTTFEIDSTDSSYEHIFRAEDYVKRLHEGASDYRIAYHPNTTKIEEEFDAISRVFWQENHPRWFVVDEVHEYNNSKTLRPIIKYARKRLMGVILSSQRICDVEPNLRTNARATVLFFANEMNDRKAIKESFGENTLEAVEALRPLIYDDVSKIVKQYPQCVLYRRGLPIEVFDLSPNRKEKIEQPAEEIEPETAGENETTEE